MAIHAALHHLTHYRYERGVSLSPQIIRLRPAPHARTPIESYSLRVDPQPHFLNWLQDPHGNFLARVVFPERVRELKVQVDLIADMTVINPFDFFIEEEAREFPYRYAPQLRQELQPFMVPPVDTGKNFKKYTQSLDLSPRSTIDFLVELNQKVEHDTDYLVRMEPGVQTPEETLHLGRGSCRDTAWLLINILRSLGFAARFASGYLIQLKPDLLPLEGPEGPTSDFTDLHAWAEVFVPGAGWIGLDPTSGLLAGEGHIPLACAPSPLSAAPISGSVEDCKTEFDFYMRVQRVREQPRVTLPYTDAQWKEILQVGHSIDEQMAAADLHLTMGGEPTFISADDMEGAEWNSSAVGPHKLRLSQQLIKRLAATVGDGAGALLHFGTGKWYPGESLPRWAYTCYWRDDGEPLWSDPSLFADIEQSLGYTEKEAARLIRELAAHLDVDVGHALPAYEDIWYYLWKEQKLPGNVDPLDSKLHDPEERKRLAEVFERGLAEPTGYVIPLQCIWQARARKWISGPWHMRHKHLFLIPGDSPIGLRLPLESLPWAASIEPTLFQDPSAPLAPLPAYEECATFYAQRRAHTEVDEQQEFGPRRQSLADNANSIRTALTVQARGGNLFVFMPPCSTTADYIDLVAAIEAAAKRLNYRIILEGDRPPADPRLHSFKITPDPGVIEVNMHPSASWQELVDKTETLYEQARLTRLSTEKFMLDGRHVGTGGGNHMILGGATPEQSPLLRRPDLLRSMIAYWLHHPSLSYLFSGLFIGPTSQSPRIDEARQDSLYELEIAFKELDPPNPPNLSPPHFGNLNGKSSSTPPWLVDRIFRNLLTDVTGNTHRTEFCIDKLYSPDSSSGRLGLVELRSFEMPPHARMSLAQQLLLRALVLHLWNKPYRPVRLKRWGTQLHDRFLLPYFVWDDFTLILEELRLSGLGLKPEWFIPHREFRFPKFGEVTYRAIRLEIRHALEPWHVMGEEGFAGGTVRYVDSSLERVQVLLSNMDEERYALLCNGRRVPLTPTGEQGQYVAGVRFRAWQPASCLHPTLGVDTPLNFELVDKTSSQSIGGCTYYVAHPAGRNYETFPVNAFEAEARRSARFEPRGVTPGATPFVPEAVRSRDFPLTLDLRTC